MKYRNSVVKLIHQCKEDYFKSYLKNKKKKSKEIWSGISNLITVKNSKKSQQIPSNINNQTQMIFFIANQLNNFFTSIASKLVEKIPTSKKTFDIFIRRNNKNTFFMSPTSTDEVEDTINSFYLNKAVGPNTVPTKILKNLKK